MKIHLICKEKAAIINWPFSHIPETGSYIGLPSYILKYFGCKKDKMMVDSIEHIYRQKDSYIKIYVK